MNFKIVRTSCLNFIPKFYCKKNYFLLNLIGIYSQTRPYSRQVYRPRPSQKGSNLVTKRKRFGLSWLSISVLFVGGLIFWPVTLPVFAVGFAAITTAGTVMFIGGWMLFCLVGIFVMCLALAIPGLKVYYDFRKIEAKQEIVANWQVVDQRSGPWFGHRWAKPKDVHFKYVSQHTKVDEEGNVQISSDWIQKVQNCIEELHGNVRKVVEKEAKQKGLYSRNVVWLERTWLYFFKFSIPFELDLDNEKPSFLY